MEFGVLSVVAGVLIGATILYLIFIGFVGILCLRPPRIPVFLTPKSLGLPEETVRLSTSDGVKINAWLIKNPDSKVSILLLHGFAMNRCEMVPLANSLYRHGITMLIPDFRCHGNSGGKFSGIGFHEAPEVVACAKLLNELEPDVPTVILGGSMGAVAAAYALSQEPELADALVLDSAYSRMNNAIDGWWRTFGGERMRIILWPVRFFAWPIAKVNPWKADVAQILRGLPDKPVLFLHGDADLIAEPREAERNFAHFKGRKKIVWFPNSRHSEARLNYPSDYERVLLEFLQEHGIGDFGLEISSNRVPASSMPFASS
jgi:pimeloyl-ACP methyl ester carboxylesterase